jgi:hypothetical protein
LAIIALVAQLGGPYMTVFLTLKWKITPLFTPVINKCERKPKIIYTRLSMVIVLIFGLSRRGQNDKIMMTTVLLRLYKKFKILAT